MKEPALWPAPGVVFDTLRPAASDFVSGVLGVPLALGDFQQSDSASGEIQVFSPSEGGGRPIVRSVLQLRRLGQDEGWHVIVAVNRDNTIDSPFPGEGVARGPVNVSGRARGFEGTVVVEAFVAGKTVALDQVLVN